LQRPQGSRRCDRGSRGRSGSGAPGPRACRHRRAAVADWPLHGHRPHARLCAARKLAPVAREHDLDGCASPRSGGCGWRGTSPARVNLPTFAISVLMLGLILGLQRWAPKVPAPLVAVVLGIGLAAAVGLDSYGVQLVGKVPSGLPGFVLPQLSLVPKLWLPAL